jgi:hypothetical protein
VTFFLYKIIFPECGKLYFGRTCQEFRYGSRNPVGNRFIGPHHNVEVQKLLDSGFIAFFIRTGWCKTQEQSKLTEGNFLQKVWPTGEWNKRPWWLLNRTNRPVGFATGSANPRFLPHNQEACLKRIGVMHTPEVNAKRTESLQRLRNQPEWVHPSIGKTRPDLSERNKTQAARVKSSKTVSNTNLITYPCPYCDKFMNAGNLSKHIKVRHAQQSGLPE